VLRPRWQIALTAALVLLLPLPSGADDRAAILLYHHVSEATPASTSVTPAVFEAHLDYLARNDYRVLALPELLRALAQRAPLPARAVAITFDDAYRSVLTEALPRLKRRSWPFAVFVSTDYVDGGLRPYLSWDELRALEAAGGTIANHSRSHPHFVRRHDGETAEQWRARISREVLAAQQRLSDELEAPARILAYPYGEYDEATESLAADLGFIALSQQSGPVGYDSPLTALPRFPVATGFDDLNSLADKLASRPLPATVLSPDSRILAPTGPPPVLELRLAPGAYRADALRCYVSGQPPAELRWTENDEALAKKLVVQARNPLPAGRSKYTCTAPSTREPGVFYWYTHLWIKPNADGSWYSG
jgi:peptidoglycan/xylan/chitin deacetylase (PgdA/CDA1 family)